MKAVVKSATILTSVKSASAIGKTGKHIFIVSDNSNYLWLLNDKFQIQEKLQLYLNNSGLEEIPKPLKADLECFLLFQQDGEEYILLAGSGSLEEKRDRGFLLYVNKQEKITLKEISLSLLYNEFRKISSINIEGIIAQQDKILFISRGNASDNNRVFSIDSEQFFEFVFQQQPVFSDISSYELTTPLIHQTATGITEAFYANTIFFTATAECTHNSYDDGKIEGSMFLQMHPVNKMLAIKDYAIAEDINGNIFKKKIEGVLVKEMTAGKILLWAVTDNDSGDSDLLEIELTL